MPACEPLLAAAAPQGPTSAGPNLPQCLSPGAGAHRLGHHPLVLPSMCCSQKAESTATEQSSSSAHPPVIYQSGHSTSCPSEKPTFKKVMAYFANRGYDQRVCKPSYEASEIPTHSFLPSGAISTSCCLLHRLLGLLFNICAARTQQFMVVPTSSVYPLNTVPQRCSIKDLLTALPHWLYRILVALPDRWRWSSSYAPSGSRPDVP